MSDWPLALEGSYNPPQRIIIIKKQLSDHLQKISQAERERLILKGHSSRGVLPIRFTFRRF
jgi:hypothetical protein